MKIILATHVLSTGPSQELRKYILKKKPEMLLWISHPLKYSPRLQGNGFEFYAKGELAKSHYNKIKKIPRILSYFLDFILNIYYSLLFKGVSDLYIGFDNLNAFSGLILKRIGKVKKCIYYVVDYTPQRFDNGILNAIYHYCESYCAIHCDETWNLSPKMIEAREKYKNLKKEDCGPQRIVPMGIWFEEIEHVPLKKVKKHQLIYMGELSKKQGIQYVLKAIPLIKRTIPDFTFLIIGDGEYLPDLMNLVSELEIENHVNFAGYIDDESIVYSKIASSAMAVALYERGSPEKNFTYYSDPGKIKTYLGGGIPVILTDVPHNAKEIDQQGCGKIIDIDPQSISNAVLDIINNEEKLKMYRSRALSYGKMFDWNLIFDKAFKNIVETRWN